MSYKDRIKQQEWQRRWLLKKKAEALSLVSVDTPEVGNWKSMDWLNPDYDISDSGKVRRRMRHLKNIGRFSFPKHKITKHGYCHIRISHGKHQSGKHYLVHMLVMRTFVGPKPEGLQINHIDGNKMNNCVSNLEYVTARENIAHAIRTGLRGRI